MATTAHGLSAGLPQGQPVTLETIRNFERFAALEQEWDALVEQAGIEHPFLQHAWVRTWWEAFGADRTLHIVVVRRDGAVAAIAPLMSGTERMYGLPVIQTSFIHNDHTPRFDLIAAADDVHARAAIWEYLFRNGAQSHLLKLCQLTAGAAAFQEMPAHAAQHGWQIGMWPSIESPYVLLPATWDEYARSLDRDRRQNVMRRYRKLQAQGEVRLEVVTGGDALEQALHDGFRLEALGWKGQEGTAIVSDKQVEYFYRTLAARMAARGALHLGYVTVGGRRIAFHFCLTHRNRLFTLKPGYDPEFRAFGPGAMLTLLTIRWAIEQGLQEYDLLGSAEPWKLDWTERVRPHHWAFAFHKGIRGEALHCAKFRVLPWLRQQRMYAPLRNTVLGWTAHLKRPPSN